MKVSEGKQAWLLQLSQQAAPCNRESAPWLPPPPDGDREKQLPQHEADDPTGAVGVRNGSGVGVTEGLVARGLGKA